MQTLFSNSDQIIIDAYNAYQSSLINYISVRVGDKELAKDLSQDVHSPLLSQVIRDLQHKYNQLIINTLL